MPAAARKDAGITTLPPGPTFARARSVGPGGDERGASAFFAAGTGASGACVAPSAKPPGAVEGDRFHDVFARFAILALRLRLSAVKNISAAELQHVPALLSGTKDSRIVLELDYWALLPRR